MANVTAFKGYTYNKERILDFGDVCTPPYDVISKEEQEAFYKKHPNNIIRLILSKKLDTDTETDTPHTRAAKHFTEFIEDRVLVQDPEPAMYLTSVDFKDNKDQPLTRFGMIVRVGLEPFEKGIILPHEKTFSKVKSERLSLMKQCHANFSPIFSLYSDPENTAINCLKVSAGNRPADQSFTDTKGLMHHMWRITDPTVLEKVTGIMADKVLYIADGHHRYETALNYRNWAAENRPGFSDTHGANYVMMYISSMDEPGLTIFPAHRIISRLSPDKLAAFMENAARYFEIRRFPFTAADKETTLSDFLKELEANQTGKAIGVYIKNNPEFTLMVAKDGVMEALFSNEMAQCLLDLDVTVLTRLIFMEILGFDQAMLDNEQMISYNSNAKAAVATVSNQKDQDVAFILNPTRIEQVKQVAQEGFIMPRKSTYFYPKVITGQAIHRLD